MKCRAFSIQALKARGDEPLPAPGRVKDHPDQAHVPLEEYRGWKTWIHP